MNKLTELQQIEVDLSYAKDMKKYHLDNAKRFEEYILDLEKKLIKEKENEDDR